MLFGGSFAFFIIRNREKYYFKTINQSQYITEKYWQRQILILKCYQNAKTLLKWLFDTTMNLVPSMGFILILRGHWGNVSPSSGPFPLKKSWKLVLKKLSAFLSSVFIYYILLFIIIIIIVIIIIIIIIIILLLYITHFYILLSIITYFHIYLIIYVYYYLHINFKHLEEGFHMVQLNYKLQPIESPSEYVLLDQILRKFNISSTYSSSCVVFSTVY